MKPKYILNKLKGLLRSFIGYRPVYNVFGRQTSKTALLVHLTKPFTTDKSDRLSFTRHQNWTDAVVLASALDKAGYAVDVIDCNDRKFRPAQDYDVVIGLGRAVARIAKQMPSHTTKIFYMTGTSPDVNNKSELERLTQLKQRKGVLLKPRRLSDSPPEALSLFDGVIGKGTDATAGTVRAHNSNIILINNQVPDEITVSDRNYAEAGKHFLFMSSTGQVHRGLDLLLEAFVNMPEYHLHILGSYGNENDFCATYRKELYDTDNIHAHGWVHVLDEKFAAIAGQCSFFILPTCAEGQAGTVLCSMKAGLIPVVTPEAGITMDEHVIPINDCSIKGISKTVKECSSMSHDQMALLSAKVASVARTRYNVQAFETGIDKAVSFFLNKRENHQVNEMKGKS